jgi:hypothetical protein
MNDTIKTLQNLRATIRSIIKNTKTPVSTISSSVATKLYNSIEEYIELSQSEDCLNNIFDNQKELDTVNYKL